MFHSRKGGPAPIEWLTSEDSQALDSNCSESYSCAFCRNLFVTENLKSSSKRQGLLPASMHAKIKHGQIWQIDNVTSCGSLHAPREKTVKSISIISCHEGVPLETMPLVFIFDSNGFPLTFNCDYRITHVNYEHSTFVQPEDLLFSGQKSETSSP